MPERALPFNAEPQAAGPAPIATRIGTATGDVIAGCSGTPQTTAVSAPAA